MTRSSAVRIAERLARVGVAVADDRLDALATYYDLLYRWNARINLTALPDGDSAIDRLIVEPVVASSKMPETAVHLDVGSGGGSPALPIRVMRPLYRTLLVESRGKKVAFLREAIRELALASEAQVSSSRLEALAVPAEPFNLITIRAVRIDNVLRTALERLSSSGATVWCFVGPAETGEFGAGWQRGFQMDLVPDQLSRVQCFTWNSPADVARGTSGRS